MNDLMANQVDILLSTYNGQEYIREQIASLFEQDYGSWRLIIRDDGSTDNTKDILREYEISAKERCLVIRDELGNLGPCRSFSTLLEKSDAPYVMFCDQDDIWVSSKISIFIKRMRDEESRLGTDCPILLHSDLAVTDSEMHVIADSMWNYQGLNPARMNKLENLLIQNHVTGCATMINRKLANLSAPIPDGVIMHDWWLALVAVTCGKLIHIPDKTVLYRQHGANDVGAKKWGVEYIIRSISSIPAMMGGFQITLPQAAGLLALERDFVDEGTRHTVEKYIEIFEKGWLQRKIAVYRLGIYKYGFLRNLAMLALI